MSLPLFIPNLSSNPRFPGVLRACGFLFYLRAGNNKRCCTAGLGHAQYTPAEKGAKDNAAGPPYHAHTPQKTRTDKHPHARTQKVKQPCRATHEDRVEMCGRACVRERRFTLQKHLRRKLQNQAVRVVTCLQPDAAPADE